MQEEVTIYESLYSTSKGVLISVDQALNRIKSGKHKVRIDRIRAGEKEEKKKLPIVLFSGAFASRNDSDLKRHSGMIVLDFDGIKKEDINSIKSVLATDQYVRSCWVSPSGEGLKVLVQVTNPERHRDHFRSLSKYFTEQYALEVDATGINESRACFESYDPELVIKDSIKYGGMLSDAPVVVKADFKVTTDYSKLAVAANMIRRAKDGEKHHALIRAATLIGGFIAAGKVEEEEAFRVLEREISLKDVKDITQARNTISDGIEKGKTLPISETVAEEDKIRREMRILDGDMSFISSDDEDYKWIEDYKEGRIPVGLTTGSKTLDEYFVFKKEFVMINGHSNIGKTAMTMYLMVAASINHNWKWVVYAAENKTAAIKMKLMQYAVNKPIRAMNYMELQYAREWVNKHFTIIDNKTIYSYYDILLFTEKIHRMEGIDGALIDPYNSLRVDLSSSRGIGTHEYHYEAASEFLTTSTRLGIATWVNAHSFTESQRRKDDDGHPSAPFAEDTEHGGKWVNRSDCFITLHRKIQHPDFDVRNTTEFHVRKVREKETGGQPTRNKFPIRFIMNSMQCGFVVINESGGASSLFTPIMEKNKGYQSSM
jgi:hypothetical protein